MGLALFVHTFRAGQPAGQFQFDADANRTIKIGRLSSAQLKLEDPSVARIHAVIELAGQEVSLIDMGSTSGTQVNGVKAHKVKLNHGDQITVGETTLMVGIGEPPVVAQAAPVQPAPVMAGQQMPAPGLPAPGLPAPGLPAPGLPAPGLPAQQMPAPGLPMQQQVAQPPQAASMPRPTQPRFDGGLQSPEVRRITKERLTSAAVESKPHPSLPPEPQMSVDNRVLEVRIYWGEVLLAMHHYAKPKCITIGENKRTDFFISSEGLPIEEFPLIRYMDDDYVLSFTTGMEGELEIANELRSLNQIRGSSLVRKDDSLDSTYNLKLPIDARGLLHWGGATFALRFVSPPTPIPNEFFKSMDLQYVNMLLLSLFFHIATMVTFLVFPYDTDALRVDLFDEPDRFAQLVLEGPQETESTKDLLEKLKKNVEEKKKKIKPPEEKVDLKVTKKQPQVQKPVKTKSQKKAEVAQKFSKLFTGSSGGAGSLLGGGGGGTLAGTLSNVIGTTGKGSATAGIAGLGIRGDGPLTGGGIGTSRGIAGIGTSGRLGGGGLAYGSGVSMGKRKERGMISLSTPVIMGALPPEVIKKVINQNKNQIRYCYEIELQRNQNLEGRIMMSWIIAATGSVAKVRVKTSTIKNANVERCIAAKIKTWKFPAPAGGGIVEVNYPFVLRSG